MDEDETIFPMDIIDRDPSFRPWNFRPQGYLVVILADVDEAQRAETALVQNGFASQDIKLYTGEQILKTNERYKQHRGVASKALGVFGDDVEGRDLYLGYARENRCAMWVRIPDEADVPKALRTLADFNYLHARAMSSSSNPDPVIDPCLPPASDYDCAGGSGDGPEYTGPVRVIGSDPYGLDADNDGYGCE